MYLVVSHAEGLCKKLADLLSLDNNKHQIMIRSSVNTYDLFYG